MIENNFDKDLGELADLVEKVKDKKLKEVMQKKIGGMFGPVLYAKYFTEFQENEMDLFDFKYNIRQLAEEYQSVDAMMYLANYAINNRDYNEGKKYFEMAADKGFPPALCNMAWWYLGNYADNDPDYAKAYEYALKAAEKGDGFAMNILGELYEYGDGVNVDLKKALYWYEEGVKAGYVISAYNAARVINNSSPSKDDEIKCAMLVQTAAARNYKPAIAKLAEFYMEGIGVKKDLAYARMWLNRADQFDETVKELEKRLKCQEKKNKTGKGKIA